MLAVIGGELRGRKIRSPEGVRPTSAKVREAVFDLLQAHPRAVTGARWLDVCAGTGAMGIEALSRGAAAAVFVEQSRPARAVLARNLRDLGLEARATVVAGLADAVIADLARRSETFDAVFLDPPYRDDPAPLIDACRGVLSAGGILVAELATRRVIDLPEGTRRRRYGDTTIALVPGIAP
ncbi:MAG: 16S rRNA (guanine(966)-N(2))-methyltransferase RsmD [Acidobacteriota bacterium]